ncbi:MAG TPA: hypothetical protein VM925_27500 [Labilithrix sp.]|nr:hypothetical protein [Labilithrix sp.]
MSGAQDQLTSSIFLLSPQLFADAAVLRDSDVPMTKRANESAGPLWLKFVLRLRRARTPAPAKPLEITPIASLRPSTSARPRP